MTTLLAVFLLTFLVSLLLTPCTRIIGAHLGIVDIPNSRKIHEHSIPRCGGCSVIASFCIGLAVFPFIPTDITRLLDFDSHVLAFLSGSLICFLTGLADDIKRVSYRIKLVMQVIAASIAFWGGLHIDLPFGLEAVPLAKPLFSYVFTVFWFLLFINAVNLIDGLDGLAGGIVLFVCLFMLVFLVLDKNYVLALFFALLGGSIAGFLPFNFSDSQKIFLGDSGSYFLGFALAGLGVMGSIKSHIGATMLIPLVAMGVPVFDTLLAPVRRFILAKEPFKPDKGHIHHRLMAMGLSNSRVVMIIYGATLVLCLAAVFIVNIEDETIGLFLVVLGSMAALFARKVGYLSFVDNQKIQSWFRDFSFVTGIAKDRRRFLNLQLSIQDSKTLDDLWAHLTQAFAELKLDFAEVHLESAVLDHHRCEDTPENPNQPSSDPHGVQSRSEPPSPPFFRRVWTQNGFEIDTHGLQRNLFKLELPLQLQDNHVGELWVIKDIKHEPINHYTLTRIEHMRRSISRFLIRMQRSEDTHPPGPHERPE